MSGLFEEFYRIAAQIPAGRVATYGQIAALAGIPRAARTVGWALHTAPAGLPWHRIVNRKGVLPPGTGFSALQRALLEGESVPFLPDGRVDLSQCLWQPDPHAGHGQAFWG